MKKLIFPSFVVMVLTSTTYAQVQIDKPLNLNGGTGQRSITNLEAPVNGTDAVNKDYVDAKVASAGGGAAIHGSALGTAMITAYMDSIGLFSPHGSSKCDGTEAYVPLFSGASVGYCIEKNERTAAYWTDAVRTCLSLGKRLPEPDEWQYACDNLGTLGLNTMTDNFEWATNFPIQNSYGGTNRGVSAALFGGGGCDKGLWWWLGSASYGRDPYTFRCVR